MLVVLEWRMLVRRLAAGVGALCGLVSLLYDAPVWTACVRAGAACFLIAALGRLGERVLASSAARVAADERPEEPSTDAPASPPQRAAEAAPAGR